MWSAANLKPLFRRTDDDGWDDESRNDVPDPGKYLYLLFYYVVDFHKLYFVEFNSVAKRPYLGQEKNSGIGSG